MAARLHHAVGMSLAEPMIMAHNLRTRARTELGNSIGAGLCLKFARRVLILGSQGRGLRSTGDRGA